MWHTAHVSSARGLSSVDRQPKNSRNEKTQASEVPILGLDASRAIVIATTVTLVVSRDG
jgi:hypothetical protein